MYAAMTQLIDCLDRNKGDTSVINWACPVPYFGAVSEAMVATVGINPSDREFSDSTGAELIGNRRRLPTLTSLGVRKWSQASGMDIRGITAACADYFERNPYRQWFDVLDRLLMLGGASLYQRREGVRACHLDLVAFATLQKWSALDPRTRRMLVNDGQRSIAAIIRDSDLRLLVLNGRSVVREFEGFSQTELKQKQIPEWTLPRRVGRGVPGISYNGKISQIAGVDLGREIMVIGYNHNLQSSFGVTSAVIRSIGERVGSAVVAAINL